VGGQDEQVGGVLLESADLRVGGAQLLGVVAHRGELVGLQQLLVVAEVADEQQRMRMSRKMWR
jgi:hypothetical protein